MQNAVDDDAFELVNLADWDHLTTFYASETSLPSQHPARRSVFDCLHIMLRVTIITTPIVACYSSRLAKQCP